MKLYEDFIFMCKVLDEDSYDPTRITRLLEMTDDGYIDEVFINRSVISSIRRFYEGTNEYNRSKIANLINNNITNFKKVHQIVIDYELAKSTREKSDVFNDRD